MATRGSQVIPIGPFMGLWIRGDTPPPDHFPDAIDTMFNYDTIYPRPPFAQIRTLAAQPLRCVPFKLSGNPIGSRWLMLALDPGGSGTRNVYDVTVGGPSTLIASGLASTITDMSVVVVYDRAYISFHNRVVGEAFHSVIVWDPNIMVTARLAAGLAPTGTFTAGISATNGVVEPGLHILAVAYETDTGHVTVPGLYGSITMPNPRKKIDLSVIPTGPTGTVKRHILMSKVVNNFDGNFRAPELFYAKRIDDNVTTSQTGVNGLDVYDTQLQASADYLKDQHEAIPSGVGMCMYASRLVLGNVNIPLPPVPNLPPLPPKAERSLIIGSTTNDLESFSKLDGFRQLSKSEGGGIKQMSEVNGILYVRKSFMTFALQDNGQALTKWPISQLDVATGTECYGIATFPGTSAGSTKGIQLVADRAGLFLFDGVYGPRPVSWKIEWLWRTIDPGRFAEIMVTVDPERNRLAVLLPPHVSPTGEQINFTHNILEGDFTLGLDPDNIRWSYWSRIVTATNKDCVGLNYDYRESIIPSLTAVMKDTGHSGEILALPDDLALNVARRSMTLRHHIQLHPDGGKATLIGLRYRMALVTSPSSTFGISVFNELDASDPNPFLLNGQTPKFSNPGFNRFVNNYRRINRAMLETVIIHFTTSTHGISRFWVFVNPNIEETPSGA